MAYVGLTKARRERCCKEGHVLCWYTHLVDVYTCACVCVYVCVCVHVCVCMCVCPFENGPDAGDAAGVCDNGKFNVRTLEEMN